MRDVRDQELVAVKLIPRPIPKAIIPEHVFREIKARPPHKKHQNIDLWEGEGLVLLLARHCTEDVYRSWHNLRQCIWWLQIQAELGAGHISIVNAKEAVLTEKHLALVMEYAAGGSLTAYVSQRWQHATHTGLFLGEDEARYFFRVRLDSPTLALNECMLMSVKDSH